MYLVFLIKIIEAQLYPRDFNSPTPLKNLDFYLRTTNFHSVSLLQSLFTFEAFTGKKLGSEQTRRLPEISGGVCRGAYGGPHHYGFILAMFGSRDLFAGAAVFSLLTAGRSGMKSDPMEHNVEAPTKTTLSTSSSVMVCPGHQKKQQTERKRVVDIGRILYA
ncbi:hypothetical protein LXL04_020753 [Taraxacum kok-saghyz]